MAITYSKALPFIIVSLISLGILALIGPISQDISYHDIADERQLLSLPKFMDTISNATFLLAGTLGLFFVFTGKLNESMFYQRPALSVFFTGVFFTGIGSACYHLNPDNSKLVWDRLPMTLAFMAFFSLIIGGYINQKTGKLLLFPLVVCGVLSVVYWYLTEQAGQGDLRPYALVQFLPFMLIPVTLFLFKSDQIRSFDALLVLLFYVLSKFFETFDYQVFSCLKIISGHTIKHLLASIAAFYFLWTLQQKKPSMSFNTRYSSHKK